MQKHRTDFFATQSWKLLPQKKISFGVKDWIIVSGFKSRIQVLLFLKIIWELDERNQKGFEFKLQTPVLISSQL